MSNGDIGTYSYGTLTPNRPIRQHNQQQRATSHSHLTPGGMRNRSGYPEGEDDEVLKGEGEFSEEVDDRTDWMRSGRQGKATVASCVSK